ncbi:OmpA family protein [Entomobacter blattae]|uniref:Outer membrane protein n=1 Tax=Entomobacter blattae TaxID=2762277 RepID=A0A7H1NUV3_9PROT|nr:OmpA family protein [Entomobacter blattae]QNT79563.1 Outer membrane protein [Entomobacter blattae]
MRLRTALLTTTLMAAAPAAAMASTVTGPYVSVNGGYNLVQSTHATFSPSTYAEGINSSAGSKSRYRHGTGFTGFGSFGWGFGNGLRVEVEGVYNYSNITHRTGTAAPGHTRGHDQGYGGFVNALYDIDLREFGIDIPVTPFVGIGVGAMVQHFAPITTTFANGGTNRIGGTNGNFAYQGIIGASYDIPDVPGLAVTTEYRMMGQLDDQQAFASTSYGIGGVGGLAKGNVNVDHRFNHQFILGLRYAFDTAPPPPPPVAPAVVPQMQAARTYLVFFDWDRSNLTPRARQIVAQAAQASTHVTTTRIEVNGYTDNSAAHPGPRGQRYNMGLSIRRAQSVKAELIRNGVPASAIDIHGYGESHPLVPTGPNTREPQNRRVEIILH